MWREVWERIELTKRGRALDMLFTQDNDGGDPRCTSRAKYVGELNPLGLLLPLTGS
jgi:hypothetical protein